MSERKEFPTHIEGIPVAKLSVGEKIRKSTLDISDEIIRTTGLCHVGVPFLSDSITHLHEEKIMSDPEIQELDRELTHLGEQMVQYQDNAIPSILKLEDISGQEYIGTYLAGSYLKKYYRIDIGSGQRKYHELCLDFPFAFLDKDSVYCLFIPSNFRCVNESLVKDLREGIKKRTDLGEDIKHEIMADHSRLHRFNLNKMPDLYQLADWRVMTYSMLLFKLLDNRLFEKRIDDELYDLDEYVYEINKVSGSRFRIHEQLFKDNATVAPLLKENNEYLRLYHLQKGSSETETKRRSKGLKLSPNSV